MVEQDCVPEACASPSDAFRIPEMIGSSPAMRSIKDMAHNAAHSRADVFLTGESGTGKRLCARHIHHLACGGADSVLPVIDCTRLGAGTLEKRLRHAHAEADMILIDSVDRLRPAGQDTLWSWLEGQESSSCPRLLCATHRDITVDVRTGRFRKDLYYRLRVLTLCMPPLRERGDDILEIARHFLTIFSQIEKRDFQEFSPEAKTRLLSHPWYGNVRELRHVICGAVAAHHGTVMTEAMLAPVLGETEDTPPAHPAKEQNNYHIQPLWKTEQEAIEQAIAICGGNIPHAASLLEIAPSTVYRKRAVWGTA